MGSFLFVPYPALGHVNPMLPVIGELVARGECVRVLAGAGYAERFSGLGAGVVRLRVSPDVFVPSRFSVRDGGRVVASWLRKLIVDCAAGAAVRREAVRERPDVIVVDPMMGCADRVVRRLGARSAVFSTTFACNAQVAAGMKGVGGEHHAGWFVRRGGFRGIGPMVRRMGWPRLVLVNVTPMLQPCRETFGENFRFVGPLIRRDRTAEAGLPWTAHAAHPLLLVSPGTVFMRGPEFFRGVVDAFGGSRWRVVMATGHLDPAKLGRLPGNVIARRHVAQLAVLARSAVFVTHAGMNSAMEALSAGVPMVCTPRSAEQDVIARRLVEMGVAVLAPEPAAGPEALRTAVEAVATDRTVRAAAWRWRDQVRSCSAVLAAADALVEYATARHVAA